MDDERSVYVIRDDVRWTIDCVPADISDWRVARDLDAARPRLLSRLPGVTRLHYSTVLEIAILQRTPGFLDMHHIDGDPNNNDLANLRLVNVRENRKP